MNTFPIVKLKKTEIRRIRNGHPWVYQRSIREMPDDLQSGDQVSVLGPRDELIGSAFYHADSKIRLRIISREIEGIDTGFFCRRLKQARQYRDFLMPDRECYRLVNSESDSLSGLIIDRYKDAILFQITSAGMEQRKDDIVEAIRQVMDPDILIERSDAGNRKYEGLESICALHWNRSGNDPEHYSVEIDGTKYHLNLMGGNKTGLYLDQIHNHQILTAFLNRYESVDLLDCFCYVGGFSLNAAKHAQVKSVTGIDQSEECITKAIDNAEANGLSGKCRFIQANGFDWLRKSSAEQPEQFDIIVLDPPSFTKNRYAVEGALRGYKELHVRALKLLKPGGTLLTFSCSHHVTEDLLRAVVSDACGDTGIPLTEFHNFQQSPDHPIIPAIPETYYLKGFAYYRPEWKPQND